MENGNGIHHKNGTNGKHINGNGVKKNGTHHHANGTNGVTHKPVSCFSHFFIERTPFYQSICISVNLNWVMNSLNLLQAVRKSQEQFEETPLLVAILTYIGYGLLVLFGYMREMRRYFRFEKSVCAVEPEKTRVSCIVVFNWTKTAGVSDMKRFWTFFSGVCPVISKLRKFLYTKSVHADSWLLEPAYMQRSWRQIRYPWSPFERLWLDLSVRFTSINTVSGIYSNADLFIDRLNSKVHGHKDQRSQPRLVQLSGFRRERGPLRRRSWSGHKRVRPRYGQHSARSR